MLAARMREIAGCQRCVDLIAAAEMIGVPPDVMPVDAAVMQAHEAAAGSSAVAVSAELIAGSQHPGFWLSLLLTIAGVGLPQAQIAVLAARRAGLDHPLALLDPDDIVDARSVYDLRARGGQLECSWPDPAGQGGAAVLLIDQREPLASWAWAEPLPTDGGGTLRLAIPDPNDAGPHATSGRLTKGLQVATSPEASPAAGWLGPLIVIRAIRRQPLTALESV